MRNVVRGLAFTSSTLYILNLDQSASKWVLHESIEVELPRPLNGTLGSLAVKENNSTSWTFYVAVDMGLSNRAHNLFPYHANWRSSEYHPYGGDGIYNGEINLLGIASFEVQVSDGQGKGICKNFKFITSPSWSGGLMNLNLGLVNLDGDDMLVAGSRTGLLYGVPVSKVKGQEVLLLPAVELATKLVFKSKKIDAKPMGFTDNHLIVAGENGLNFLKLVSINRRERIGQALSNPFGILRVGEVLENNAVLVTGQTPTVSYADWDQDGMADIIAGSSEGRVFLSRQAPSLNGNAMFHRPVPIHHNDSGLVNKDDSISSEILVQGGYGMDIQGPRESRWGYTAPVAIDWNNDTLVDLISSDNSGRILIYIRYRDARNNVGLHNGVPLLLDGLELHTTWRNGPTAAVFDGRMALVTSDEQDEAHLYFRMDDYNLVDGGSYVKHQGKEIYTVIGPVNFLHAGATGRLKYALIDFNEDGLLDLFLGTNGYHAIPSQNSSGFPACVNGSSVCRENGATVLVMLQSRERYGEGQLVFEWPLWLTTKGARVSYGGQELGLAPKLSNNGAKLEGLILATPGGRHVYWAKEDLGTSVKEPPLA